MRTASKAIGLREAAGLLGVALTIYRMAQAVIHLHDLSGIQHLAGIWMALAEYVNQGVFYPLLEADGFYAGTRYMPLLFLLMAGLARIGLDYLLAAKLSALLSMVLLLWGVLVAVLRQTGRLIDAFALAGLVLAFPEGLSALLSPHADALPIGLTVYGLMLLDREAIQRWRVVLAAFLFALALSAKFSAVAGPAAAAALLWWRGQRLLAILVSLLFVGLAGLEVAVIQWASDGRFLENLRSLGSGGMTAEFVRLGPGRLMYALVQFTPFLIIWPTTLLLLITHRRQVFGSVWGWYLLTTLAVTIVIFTSPGTGFNHLLELQVACVLVLPVCLREHVSSSGEDRFAVLLRLGTLSALVLAQWQLIGPPDPRAISPKDLARTLPKDKELLCEDASVPVLLGRRPVVMDPFAFRVLAERGVIDDGPLAERIGKQEFAALVMLGRIDLPGQSLCPHFHFGERVTKAMLRAYEFRKREGGYYVYKPYETAIAARNQLR